ncbi:glutamate--cysteine ligase [Pusillimonas sp. CC-YST705]|uniref:Glutamate--cysteine ligase n=1 Tax=Mesopusillimonas faecipullorum TaxID=2755040 RepID=A0ABS8CCF7_9BURK|nr:glutamate--cysteine ligase [Mesopusillimonas faecipullorum]MCB5363712.1 glutamate--cysteine ligase [Mesopusillimonas faecipullorum]
MTSTPPHLARLAEHLHLITAIQRGIEKEGLRTDQNGNLAMTPHPRALGSTLTNPYITTDYSEALLELITRPHHSVTDVLAELSDIHRYTAQRLDGEIIWNQSMPAHLPPEADIPIAWYGTSNSGMLRHVYRRGLAERYGKAMQCIAGVHYNFSMPDDLWQVLETPGDTTQDRRSKGYLGLIRNFIRYAWLIMYLFGASPAVSRSFLPENGHGLQLLDDDTLYLPHATSLRMSDLGYSNKAQSDLQLCYNDIETFVERMHRAVTTPWPAYEAIGTHRDGQWIQLNTNVLQIENEYYSSIRPKRTTQRGERPATALATRGVEYVEIRCLDIDPYSPAGLSGQTARFIDTFLLFCTVDPSPFFSQNGFCQDSQHNFGLVCREGRQPGLMLARQGQSVSLQDWGIELLERMQPYAQLLDQTEGSQSHAHALQVQIDKLRDVELTPSASLLRDLRESGLSLHDFTLAKSQAHHQHWLNQALPPSLERQMDEAAKHSLTEQQRLEASDAESFDEYVAQFHAALALPPAA